MDNRIRDFDRALDSNLELRRTLERRLSEPPFSDVSGSPEMKELRIRRALHGPVTEQELEYNDFELWVASHRPSMVLDATHKQVFGEYLKKRHLAMETRRKPLGAAAIALLAVLIAVFFPSQVITWNSQDTIELPTPGVSISRFQNTSSGRTVAAPSLDAAKQALMDFDGENESIFAIHQWLFNDESKLAVAYTTPADSMVLLKNFQNEKGPSADFRKALVIYIKVLSEGIKSGELPPYLEEYAELDGKEYLFQEWAIALPNGVLRYRKGYPPIFKSSVR